MKGIRFENGTQLRMDDIINEQLQEDAHIWVILKGIEIVLLWRTNLILEDMEAISESKKSKAPLASPNSKSRTGIRR